MIYLCPFIWLMNNIVFSHITARNYIFIDRLKKSFGNVWLFDIVMNIFFHIAIVRSTRFFWEGRGSVLQYIKVALNLGLYFVDFCSFELYSKQSSWSWYKIQQTNKSGNPNSYKYHPHPNKTEIISNFQRHTFSCHKISNGN